MYIYRERQHCHKHDMQPEIAHRVLYAGTSEYATAGTMKIRRFRTCKGNAVTLLVLITARH